MADGLLDGIVSSTGAAGTPLVNPEVLSAAIDALKDAGSLVNEGQLLHGLSDFLKDVPPPDAPVPHEVEMADAAHGAASATAAVADGVSSVASSAEQAHTAEAPPAPTVVELPVVTMAERMQAAADEFHHVTDLLQQVHDAQVHVIDGMGGGGSEMGASGSAEATSSTVASHGDVEYGVSASHDSGDAHAVDAVSAHEAAHVIDAHPGGDVADGGDGTAPVGTGPRYGAGGRSAPQQAAQQEAQAQAQVVVVQTTDPSTTTNVSSIHDVHADTHVDHHDDTHTEEVVEEHKEEPPPEPAHVEPVAETHTEPEAAHTDP